MSCEKKHLILTLCSVCSLGCVLHGDLRVCTASPAVALQCFGAAAADAQPQETHGGRVRPLPTTARSSGDGALARAQPSVQILRECPLHMLCVRTVALKSVFGLKADLSPVFVSLGFQTAAVEHLQDYQESKNYYLKPEATRTRDFF